MTRYFRKLYPRWLCRRIAWKVGYNEDNRKPGLWKEQLAGLRFSKQELDWRGIPSAWWAGYNTKSRELYRITGTTRRLG